MPYIQPLAPGFAYGLGTLSGDGEAGLIVRLSGDDVFTVNDDPTVRSFGVLVASCKDGEMPGVFCNGGIYETDQVEGTPVAGDRLSCSAVGKFKPRESGDAAVGDVISFQNGVLRFKLNL